MRTRLGLSALTIMVIAGFSSTAALSQSAGIDEAIGPNGTVMQKHAFTPGQRNAIYNAASQQKIRPPADRIAAAVGAPVPASAELVDLPDQASGDNAWAGRSWAGVLKYAFVENQVVIVDPVAMRVVDVIHGSARP
jgi:hypothetical protein